VAFKAERYFYNSREKRLYFASVTGEEPNNHALLFCHGFADHSNRFLETAEWFADNGVDVFLFDLEGHGQSEGISGELIPLENLVLDLRQFVIESNASGQYESVFAAGHGLGAILWTHLINRKDFDPQIDGLLMLGPTLKTSYQVPRVIQEMSRYISSVSPNLPVMGMKEEFMCRDEKAQNAYLEDPLVYHGKIKAHVAAVLVEAGKKALLVADELTVPTWIGHGSDDKFASVQGARKFMESLTVENREMHIYPGFYHDLLHDHDKLSVLEDMLRWIRMVSPVIEKVTDLEDA